MITDIIKKRIYRQYRIWTFIKDWVVSLLISISGWSFLCLCYSFYEWKQPIECIPWHIYFGGIRVLILLCFVVVALFNQVSHKEEGEK